MLGLLAPFLGSVVSGAFGLLGAQQSSAAARRTQMINASLQAQQNAANLAQVQAANALQADQWERSFAHTKGAYGDSVREARIMNTQALKQANLDRALQKEFAQKGIQWRAADARAAGIHPLAAMGAQLASPSPITIGANIPTSSGPSPGSYSAYQGTAPQFQADTSRGQALANMGQDISRAISATATEYQRQQEVNSAASLLQLDNMKLQNQLLAAQIARTRGAMIGPSRPVMFEGSRSISGQGNSSLKTLVAPQPMEPVVGLPGAPWQEPAATTDIGYRQVGPNSWEVNPSKDAKSSIEDSLYEVDHFVKNRVLPSFGYNRRPPGHVKLERGEYWFYNPVLGTYEKRMDNGFRAEPQWGY